MEVERERGQNGKRAGAVSARSPVIPLRASMSSTGARLIQTRRRIACGSALPRHASRVTASREPASEGRRQAEADFPVHDTDERIVEAARIRASMPPFFSWATCVYGVARSLP
jgi:hypothetical protein